MEVLRTLGIQDGMLKGDVKVFRPTFIGANQGTLAL